MKIGVFDSGLGGLSILKAVIKKLPEYDYVYLGDTKNLPYGDKTQTEIFNFTKKAVNYLFQHDCALVLVMCNTASAKALRKLQQEWLPKHYPERRVLGPIIPTVEAVCSRTVLEHDGTVGVLATRSTVESKVYVKEFEKINPKIKVYQKSAPKLVPLIEAGKIRLAEMELDKYLKPLLESGIDTLILSGSTHYTILKSYVKKKYDRKIRIISQDDIIPSSLSKYLKNHKNLEVMIDKNRRLDFFVTRKSSEVDASIQSGINGKYKANVIKI